MQGVVHFHTCKSEYSACHTLHLLFNMFQCLLLETCVISAENKPFLFHTISNCQGMVLWCHRPTIYKAISKSSQIREFVIEQHYSWGRSKDWNILCCCKCITTTFICSITNSRIWLWQRSNEALLYYKNQAFLVCTVLYKPVYIMLAWFCWAYNRLTRNR